ncbi:MAG: hypothetical protein IPP18_13095 [Rhodocyclaceae bacterium]|nr:hypothetical protein [Rhodocyclaceae bacterium]MBK6552785.1 hypothetical protein [Rhodocyclaceae bacterium]MBK9312316.1 hypothetical protein [Rhodocyclaceae bacterium]MBK9956025.1 hypothetical protein [Rhodocyclaceae bacterium]
MTPAHRSLLVDFAILLALAAVAVIGYLYSPLLLPKSDVSATPDPGCDLNRGACRARLPDGGQVELSLSPHPIPVVRPMKIQAQISGPAAAAIDRMELDFAGITMNMGYNRVTLSPLGNGRFAGETSIPVCITGRMSWRGTLIVTTDRRQITVPFEFEAPLAVGEMTD